MELDDIRRHALAARQFNVTAGAAVFTLTMPTTLQRQVAYARATAGGPFDGVARLRFLRGMVLECVTGWSGVMLSHVLPDVLPNTKADEPLAFEPGVVELLLDAQPEWEAALSAELLDRGAKRAAELDTAAKN